MDIHQNKSFNEGFCDHLEYLLCRVFKSFKENHLRNLWCDGVLWKVIPESQLNKERIFQEKKIETIAWIGIKGQEEYKMTI